MNRRKCLAMALYALAILPVLFLISSCSSVDLYEKTVSIPGHAWKSDFKPSFTFHITDTSAAYQVYFTIRHEDKYNFNNIYVNISTRQPGDDSSRTSRYDLTLGTNEKGWLGTGMDDIYDHLIPLTPTNQEFYFRKPGDYTFTVEQIMREDPLLHVLNVGIRVDKKQ